MAIFNSFLYVHQRVLVSHGQDRSPNESFGRGSASGLSFRSETFGRGSELQVITVIDDELNS